MATQATVQQSNGPIALPYNDLTAVQNKKLRQADPDGRVPVLLFEQDVLNKILEYVGTPNSVVGTPKHIKDEEAAKNVIKAGRVCALTYVLTNDDPVIRGMIGAARKVIEVRKAAEESALMRRIHV